MDSNLDPAVIQQVLALQNNEDDPQAIQLARKQHMLAPLKLTDGLVSNPGLCFAGESSTGWWRPGAGSVALSILGLEKLRVTAADGITTAADLNVTGNFKITGNPVIESPYLGAGFAPNQRSLFFQTENSLGASVAQTGMSALWGRISDTDFNSSLLFHTSPDNNPVERMRLDSSGNIGLNCVAGVPLRIQAPGFNDIGLEWQRFDGSHSTLASYNRASSTYGGLITDAAAQEWRLSGYSVMQLNYSTATPVPQLTLRYDGGNGPQLVLANRALDGTNHRSGTLLFETYRDISNPAFGAAIWAEGTNAAGNNTNLVFGTSQNVPASILPPEQMRIDWAGNVGMSTPCNRTKRMPSARSHILRSCASGLSFSAICAE